MKHFQEQIEQFHAAFGLPQPAQVEPLTPERLRQFVNMLAREAGEFADVMVEGDNLATMTNYADWLGDIIVYCASEARRHGIPLEGVLTIIMESNMSKLGADGKAIIVDGKVQKGPNYWKPEPRIATLLLTHKGAAE